MKTRIMVEWRNNGKVFYTPQVKTGLFSGWSNIIENNNISKSARFMYDDLTQAQAKIAEYLVNLDREIGNMVKRVEYIPVG